VIFQSNRALQFICIEKGKHDAHISSSVFRMRYYSLVILGQNPVRRYYHPFNMKNKYKTILQTIIIPLNSIVNLRKHCVYFSKTDLVSKYIPEKWCHYSSFPVMYVYNVWPLFRFYNIIQGCTGKIGKSKKDVVRTNNLYVMRLQRFQQKATYNILKCYHY